MTKLSKSKEMDRGFMGWIAGRAKEPTSWLGLGLVAFIALPTLTHPLSVITWWLVVVCACLGVFLREKGEG